MFSFLLKMFLSRMMPFGLTIEVVLKIKKPVKIQLSSGNPATLK
jgi:hypothetical protein